MYMQFILHHEAELQLPGITGYYKRKLINFKKGERTKAWEDAFKKL